MTGVSRLLLCLPEVELVVLIFTFRLLLPSQLLLKGKWDPGTQTWFTFFTAHITAFKPFLHQYDDVQLFIYVIMSLDSPGIKAFLP